MTPHKDKKPSTTCKACGSPSTLKSEPNRHATSPNSINYGAKKEEDKYYDYYCSPEHRDKDQALNYACWAELDRNASDSECFEHTGWDGVYRVGRCKITGDIIRVVPHSPWDNSGQPKMCYAHFSLKKRYRDVLRKEGLKETYFGPHLVDRFGIYIEWCLSKISGFLTRQLLG